MRFTQNAFSIKHTCTFSNYFFCLWQEWVRQIHINTSGEHFWCKKNDKKNTVILPTSDLPSAWCLFCANQSGLAWHLCNDVCNVMTWKWYWLQIGRIMIMQSEESAANYRHLQDFLLSYLYHLIAYLEEMNNLESIKLYHWMLQASDLLLELGYLKSGIDIQFPMYKVSNSNTGNFAYSIQTFDIFIRLPINQIWGNINNFHIWLKLTKYHLHKY